MKELVIIGAGPAGLSAAIYGIRAGLDLVVVEQLSPGGQVINTYEVENYPGFKEPISGWELMSQMEAQARRLGVEIVSGTVVKIEKEEDQFFSVQLSNADAINTKAVIIASGASFKKLGAPGEKEYMGRGVSYCATCDGSFYKDKITAVIGGGDTALEEAFFLTRFASKVYLIHRRDEFRAGKILQNRILESEKIIPVYDSVVESIGGDGKVEFVRVKNVKNSEESTIDVDGVFVFVGFDPSTAFVDKSILNSKSQIIVDINMKTSIKGLWAAGDLRSDSKRQIVTAAADGAVAAMDAYDYINEF